MANKLRRDLGRLHAYSTLIGVMVGSGIFVVVGEAAGKAGPLVPIAYLLLAPVIVATALAYAVFTSTPLGQRPGGAYIHISRTFGSYFLGFIFMWLKWVAYIGATAFLALSFGEYFEFFALSFAEHFGFRLPPIDPIIVATVILGVFYLVHIFGVRIYGRLQTLMVLGLMLTIAVLVLPGLFSIRLHNLVAPSPLGWTGFTEVLPSLFFAYLGFEALAQAAGETKDSRRTLPKVFLFGVLISTGLYFLMSLVAVGVLPWQQLAQSKAPMAEVASVYLPFAAAALVAVGAMLAFATSVNANLIAPSRLLFVFAEDRVVPAFLSRVNPRFRTPLISLSVSTGMSAVLIWTNSYKYSFDIALQAMVLLYLAHSLTIMFLPFLNPELYQTALFRPRPAILVLAGGFAVAALAWMSYRLLLTPGHWPLFVVWSAVGTLVFSYSRIRGRRDGFDYASALRADYQSDKDSVAEQ